MYDDSQDRRELNATIQKIHTLFSTIYESISSEELKSFVSSFIPNSSDFTKYAKIDFNFFLKSLIHFCDWQISKGLKMPIVQIPYNEMTR
jgi:hypothetical protein